MATTSLMQDETLVLDRRPHWLYFTAPLGALVVLVALAVVRTRAPGWLEGVLGWLVWAGFAIWLVWTVARVVQWLMTHFQVTSHRVIYRSGVLARTGVEIPLDRINNVNFHQSILERIFQSGDLIIESAGRDGQSTFSDISQPEDVQLSVHEQIEQLRRRAQGGNPSAEAHRPLRDHQRTSMLDELERLARMHQQGALSDEEFARAKRRLLA